MSWERRQGRGGMAKAVGAWPRPWGHVQGLVGVVKAVRANPNPNPKALGAWPRPWGMAKAVGVGQGRGRVAKAV